MEEKPKDNLIELLSQLYPQIKNDGYMLHEIMKFFNVHEICLDDASKGLHRINYNKACETIKDILLLNALIKKRFHAFAEEKTNGYNVDFNEACHGGRDFALFQYPPKAEGAE